MRLTLAAALFAALAGTATPGIALAETAPAPKAAAAQAAPAASPPTAPAKPRMTAEERFKAANTTGDGRLTFAQAQAKMPRVAHDFEAIDKDRKGYVTLADICAYDAERRKARKAEKAAVKAGQSDHAASAVAPAAPAATK